MLLHLPAPQFLQPASSVKASLSEYLPPSQSRQLEASGPCCTALYFPATHRKHLYAGIVDVVPTPWNPGAQGLHDSTLPPPEKYPAVQFVHAPSSSKLPYVPAAQPGCQKQQEHVSWCFVKGNNERVLTHVTAPSNVSVHSKHSELCRRMDSSKNLPAAHNTQALCASYSLVCPAGHNLPVVVWTNKYNIHNNNQQQQSTITINTKHQQLIQNINN